MDFKEAMQKLESGEATKEEMIEAAGVISKHNQSKNDEFTALRSQFEKKEGDYKTQIEGLKSGSQNHHDTLLKRIETLEANEKASREALEHEKKVNSKNAAYEKFVKEVKKKNPSFKTHDSLKESVLKKIDVSEGKTYFKDNDKTLNAEEFAEGFVKNPENQLFFQVKGKSGSDYGFRGSRSSEQQNQKPKTTLRR